MTSLQVYIREERRGEACLQDLITGDRPRGRERRILLKGPDDSWMSGRKGEERYCRKPQNAGVCPRGEERYGREDLIAIVCLSGEERYRREDLVATIRPRREEGYCRPNYHCMPERRGNVVPRGQGGVGRVLPRVEHRQGVCCREERRGIAERT